MGTFLMSFPGDIIKEFQQPRVRVMRSRQPCVSSDVYFALFFSDSIWIRQMP